MIKTKEAKDVYLSHFERFERTAAGRERTWVTSLREAAFARFVDLGFPTTRDEEWRNTNVAPIAQTAFERAEANGMRPAPELVAPFVLNGVAPSLVFVNGRYAAELSSSVGLPDEVYVDSLAAALTDRADSVERFLNRHTRYEDEAFAALNTAFMEDGAFIHIPEGTVVEKPIHLLFVSRAPGKSLVFHPRNLIVAEANSQATIIESYVGSDNGTHFTNAVTEVVTHENARLVHHKTQNENVSAYHVGRLQIHQQRGSDFSSHVVTLGGALTRNDINAVLDGEGCECTLNGLYLAGGNQHVDNHLRVEHAKPHGSSREFFKGVLDDRATGVFSGRIIVRKDAQKTDAKQSNKNLLLSPDARVESKPQLEILADDVKCTHGATIGQLNEEALFYMRSRGLADQLARSLLIYAFAHENVSKIRVDPLRARLERALLARLPQGRQLQEVV